MLQCTLIGARPVSRSAADTLGKSSANPIKISCYPSKLQLQYCTVLSKPPSTAASLLKEICNPRDREKEGACMSQEVGTSPRFYNVRLHCTVCEHGEGEGELLTSEDGELKTESKVDSQVRLGKRQWANGRVCVIKIHRVLAC